MYAIEEEVLKSKVIVDEVLDCMNIVEEVLNCIDYWKSISATVIIFGKNHLLFKW